jgi:hypothetical protein
MGLVLGACGGGGDGASSAGSTTTAGGGSGASTTAAKIGGDGKLPAFSSEFDRVCTTQVGFPGAHAYEGAGAIHPVMLFEEYRGESLVASSRSLPDGWTIKEDTNFEDNSELAGVELIACSNLTKETPTGKHCEFEDDGTKVDLELVDTTFKLTVYTASTGKEVGTSTLEAKSTECPFIATFKKGDKKFLNQPSDDDYINALKAHVAP